MIKACLAIGLWGAAVVGYLFGPLGVAARLGCAAAAGAAGSDGALERMRSDSRWRRLVIVAARRFAARPRVAMSLVRRRGAARLAAGATGGFHARLDAFGRAGAMGGGLARFAGRSRDRRGPGARFGSRDGTRRRRRAARRLVALAARDAGRSRNSRSRPRARPRAAGTCAPTVSADRSARGPGPPVRIAPCAEPRRPARGGLIRGGAGPARSGLAGSLSGGLAP